jgi:hypothetical protein
MQRITALLLAIALSSLGAISAWQALNNGFTPSSVTTSEKNSAEASAPDFTTSLKKGAKGIADIQIVRPTLISAGKPLDFDVSFVNSQKNSQFAGPLSYDFKVIQQGKVVYERAGISERGEELITPSFEKGTAIVELSFSTSLVQGAATGLSSDSVAFDVTAN